MTHLRVFDVGDGLQMWRAVASILKQQSRTADKGWYSCLVVGRGASDFSPENKAACNVGVDVRIILRWILEKYSGKL